jgi:hypothetical protein
MDARLRPPSVTVKISLPADLVKMLKEVGRYWSELPEAPVVDPDDFSGALEKAAKDWIIMSRGKLPALDARLTLIEQRYAAERQKVVALKPARGRPRKYLRLS